MGQLIDGVWHSDDARLRSHDGAFVRQDSRFRAWISADGASGFPAEPDRYHLYVSLACPWAHRTLIVRSLKALADIISVTVVDPVMGEHGWTMAAGQDTVNGKTRLYEIYQLAQPDYTGRVTVPVLWDKKTGSIVSNESADIIRMLNSAFAALGAAPVDLYPEALRTRIDTINGEIYDSVNNGVYKAGFATSQDQYEAAFHALFATLDQLEQRLDRQRYLVGDGLTEADWRLFTTLVRFDPVYFSHFKCNWRRIVDYPNLRNYLRELYQVPGVAETVDFDHIKTHYYASHASINPTGVVPVGPAHPQVELTAAHDRGRFGA